MDDEPGTGQATGHRVLLLLLIGVVLVAATVAVTWHISGHRADQVPFAAATSNATAGEPPQATAAGRTPPSSTAPTTTARGSCPAGPVSTAAPTSVPADLEWATGGYEPLPYSPTYGPFRQSTVGLPECFAHSLMGGVIAAWTINADLFSTGWRQALDTQVARTAGYPRLLTELEATPPDGTPGIDSPAGFSVVAATADTVTVDLVLQGAGNGGLIGCSLTVSWDGGDWQLDPRPDGTLTTMPCPAVDPGTFVSWGP
jgi:hypothetical protein